MKISVSVTGPPTVNANSIQCRADFDVENIDQLSTERLVHTVHQCDAIVRRASLETPVSSNDRPAARNNSRRDGAGSSKRLATEKQVKAIHAMAGRQGIDLVRVLHDRFGVSGPSALSISEASTLIDELKNNLLPA